TEDGLPNQLLIFTLRTTGVLQRVAAPIAEGKPSPGRNALCPTLISLGTNKPVMGVLYRHATERRTLRTGSRGLACPLRYRSDMVPRVHSQRFLLWSPGCLATAGSASVAMTYSGAS